MQREIVLEDGTAISIVGRPAQGTKHEVWFGVERDSEVAVVVKVEGVAGALRREAAALDWLAGRVQTVPRLRAHSTIEISGRRVACLVMTRHDGAPPVTTDGWRRLGLALGRLATPVNHLGPLRVVDHRRFADEHARRVRELGARLGGLATAIPDWPALTSPRIPRAAPLVLTHGDPGPGNFLDDGRAGWLIDWEDAHIAPQGLDLARVTFIAWLGSGPTGFVGRDHATRARAAIAGYRQGAAHPCRPTVEETRWWLTVAGVQFIHHRWTRNEHPGPWRAAADVLRRLLTNGG